MGVLQRCDSRLSLRGAVGVIQRCDSRLSLRCVSGVCYRGVTVDYP